MISTDYKRITLDGIGTHWEIDIKQPMSSAKRISLTEEITASIESYDKAYSRFRTDSAIMSIAKSGGTCKLPPESKSLLLFYEKLYGITDGKVTPLIGNTLEDAGYDATYTLKPKKLIRSAPLWEETIEYANSQLTLLQPAVIDVGAAGKGQLIDIIGEKLKDFGLKDYMVDGGGDMLHVSSTNEPFQVGLEHPRNPDEVIGVVGISNQSICCSADNRRRWRGLHHIFDPHTAKPTQNIISVWTISDSAMIADGLATALFFCDGTTLQQHFDFEYCTVFADLTYEKSAGFSGQLFS